MSLFKTAIVLSVAIALLPSDKGKQQQLYAQAAAVIQHAATHCDRNAEQCEKAAIYWDAFKAKAAFAGALAYETLRRYAVEGSRQAEASNHPSAGSKPYQPVSAHRGTLTSQDLQATWRGGKRQGI